MNRLQRAAAKVLDLGGIYPPITTPFSKDGAVAFDHLKANVEKLSALPLRGFLVQGSNGEYVYLSPEERVEMVRRVKEAAGSHQLVLAGSGCEATQKTIDLTTAMAKAGADAAVVVTPSFYKGSMKNEALYQHFRAVADASPIPVVLYSVPANTTIDLSPQVVQRLAPHPNIVGIKDSGGDITKLSLMAHQTRNEDFQILAGSAGFLLPGLLMGCVGGICALANVLGADLCRLQTLFTEGRLDEAVKLQQRLVAPNAAVTRQFGISGLKAAMEWFGYYGGPTRPPLLPLTPEETSQLRAAFTDNGFS